MSQLWEQVATNIHKLHEEKDFLPLHEPVFAGNEKAYVMDCIEEGWVSSVGKYVDRFEEMLADFTGVKRAVAVVNGTAALHISLKLVDVQQDDEVLIPSLTFVATANAVTYTGASPHFIDISRESLGIDPEKLESYLNNIAKLENNCCINKKTGNVIRAIVPMHTFGHPVDMAPLVKLCNKWNIAIVEDAAESLGSYYNGKHTGNFGKVSALSFNGNKIITTGGGGAILTNDEKLADYAKHLTTTAKVPHAWDYVHDEIAYNYRLPNINAALGCAQLEQLNEYLTQKRNLTEKYIELFNGYDGISLFQEKEYARSNYWLQAIIINTDQHKIDEVLKILNENNVMARPIWRPLHLLSQFSNCEKSDLAVTEKLQHEIINLPSSPYLGADIYE